MKAVALTGYCFFVRKTEPAELNNSATVFKGNCLKKSAVNFN